MCASFTTCSKVQLRSLVATFLSGDSAEHNLSPNSKALLRPQQRNTRQNQLLFPIDNIGIGFNLLNVDNEPS